MKTQFNLLFVIVPAFITILYLSIPAKAQVSINADGSQPNTAAMLDVKSTVKGFLPPRMTHSELDAIVSPPDGLIVYCTDCGTNGAGGLSMFMAGEWHLVSVNCMNSVSPNAGAHVPSPNQIIWNWNIVPGAAGYKWNTTSSYATATDMGSNTSKTETELVCNSSYTRYVWAYNTCGNSTATVLTQFTSTIPPTNPSEGTHIPETNQIVWKWNEVSGATGYKWNTSDNYLTAVDIGLALNHTETGLTCGTVYTRYVWAYSGCGYSISTSLNETTSMNPAVGISIVASANQVCSGSSVTFTATPINGGSSPTFLWKKNGTTIPVANEMTFTYLPGDNDVITCQLISNVPCSPNNPATSNAVTMTVNTIPPAPNETAHVPSQSQIVWNWNTAPIATGYKWNTTNDSGTAIDIGTATTKTETGLTCLTSYTRYVWAYDECGTSVVTTLNQTTTGETVNAPTAGTHVPSLTQILWKWNAVPGSTGYKWSGVNDYNSALDLGPSLLIMESGLTCNTMYTRYVWAYSSCGNSTPTPLNQSTSGNPIASPTAGTHIPELTQITWNWNTVPGATGYKWNTTNDYSSATDMGTATTKTENGLTCNTPYIRFVWAYKQCGISIAAELNQGTLACAWTCGQNITDSRDGKTYNTVQIGIQCWLSQNMNIGLKIDATQQQTNNSTIEKYCINNVESNCNVYGGLYQWNEMMNYVASSNSNPSGVQGICPESWHIPSDIEWCQVTTFLDPSVNCSNNGFIGTDVGGKMKEAGTTHWTNPNVGATNSSGFTGLPGGYSIGNFYNLGELCELWTATEFSSDKAWIFQMAYDFAYMAHANPSKVYGFSVRCIKNQ